MGIRFLCPTCGKRINVKEQQAGLRGFCPKCGAGIDVPLESQLPSRREQTAGELSPGEQASGEQASGEQGEESQWAARRSATAAGAPTVDPLYEIPTALWYALPPGAPKPYGPIDNTGLAQWFYEGRLSVDSMVWRQDWPEWQAVAAVWPNWSPTGAGPGGELIVEPPADGSSYPLKAVKAESVVARPPVITSRGSGSASGSASRGLASPVAPTLGATTPSAAKPGAGKPGMATALPVAGATSAAIGSAVPDAGVYYRRRTNRAYITTVVVLVLIVLALGAVMVWVLMRTPPPPTPKTKAPVVPIVTTPTTTSPQATTTPVR